MRQSPPLTALKQEGMIFDAFPIAQSMTTPAVTIYSHEIKK